MPFVRPWKNLTRIEFSPEKCGVSGVLHFGRYNYVRAGPGLSVHTHDQAMEFCFLIRGRQTYRVGSRSHRLRGGDVFVTFPGEPHGTGSAPEEKGVLYWVIVSMSSSEASFLNLPAKEARVLRTALAGLPARVFRSNKQIRAHLDSIIAQHLDSKSPLSITAMRSHLSALFLEVVSIANTHHKPVRSGASTLKRLIELIEQDLSSPPSIARLANEAGLSIPRFKIWFKERTGVPPGEYVLRLRVEEACRQLKKGNENITTIAFALGFSSSQYFATVVKRYTGLTPRQLWKNR